MQSISKLAVVLTVIAGLHWSAVSAQNPDAGNLPTQLSVTDHVVGTGKQVQRGVFVVLHYKGWIYDAAAPDGKGAQIIDTRSRGRTLSYVYGYGRALRGLERGMEGMKEGGRRTIVVPPKLAYDEIKYRSPPEVPPGSALVFEVELLEVVPQAAPPDQ
jgi:FKBP-type peptidyl-prolyl cis-trans isomerase FkpA